MEANVVEEVKPDQSIGDEDSIVEEVIVEK